MQEYAQKPEKSSSDSNSRSSGQPPISEILQAYKNGTLQRLSVDEEKLFQAKTRDKSSERETLQQYLEYTHRDKSRYNSFIQGMFDTPQRKGVGNEEPLQGKFDSSSAASESTVQREVKPNNTGLPDNLKSGIENLSGYSLDDVKVHYNSDKPAQLSALAYAQGTDIHVAPGQEKHLPHEAWHVVQQKQGRVQPTMQMQGVGVNDNEGLEKEADVMGENVNNNNNIAQYKQSKLFGHSTQTIVQKRLADPTSLLYASEAVVNGAKAALVETLLDIYRAKAALTEPLLGIYILDRTEQTMRVNKLNKNELIKEIDDVRKNYPAQVFDSTKFDKKPTDEAEEKTYIDNLIKSTVAKMLESEKRVDLLEQIFGDGNDSEATQTAAATAREKINEARTKLEKFENIYIDTSGISQRVGVGGYALCGKKIFLLVDNKALPPSNKAVSTLFHESMHLKHSEILDNGGYTSSGESFRGRSIKEKLENADHYAEVARVIDGDGLHTLPFIPVDPASKVTVAKTHKNDTADTMNVRKNIMHRCRLLWSGAMDALLWAINESRNKDNWSRRNEMSKKIGMTYHRTSFFSTPYINETDLSLAEGTVNRITRFKTQVTSEMNSPKEQDVLENINKALAETSNSIENAGKAILITKGEKSDILAPQDKTPSVEKRFDDISR